jgi:TatD DNase family protein
MIRGLTYYINKKLYLAVTNEVNSKSSVCLRGPSFEWGKSFMKLTSEPSVHDLFSAVHDAFEGSKIGVDSMEADVITFAGFGEPLLRLDVLCEAAAMIKDSHHGAPLRVKTNGLIAAKQGARVASRLKDSGIDKVSIALLSANPEHYKAIMQPKEGSFSDVCSFVIACAEAGIDVECTAVERPDVNIGNVRALALSLGASGFSSSKYFG